MKLTRFEKFAIWINNHIGTIEFTLLCFILVSIPLINSKTQAVVFYISSGYLQLILLPLIIMSQNIQNKIADFHNENHYKKIEKILDIIEKSELNK